MRLALDCCVRTQQYGEHDGEASGAICKCAKAEVQLLKTPPRWRGAGAGRERPSDADRGGRRAEWGPGGGSGWCTQHDHGGREEISLCLSSALASRGVLSGWMRAITHISHPSDKSLAMRSRSTTHTHAGYHN